MFTDKKKVSETANPPSPPPAGSDISPDVLRPGESVTEFQGRARKAYAGQGGYFDFGDWLQHHGNASVEAMTHDSWAPYRSVLRERVRQQQKKETDDDV